MLRLLFSLLATIAEPTRIRIVALGDQLLNQAATTTPLRLKAHLTRTYGHVGSLTTNSLETSEVTGWPNFRVTGETSFTEGSPGQRIRSLHQENLNSNTSSPPACSHPPRSPWTSSRVPSRPESPPSLTVPMPSCPPAA